MLCVDKNRAVGSMYNYLHPLMPSFWLLSILPLTNDSLSPPHAVSWVTT